MRQYSENKDETFVRGFLGRMLFSGEETLKLCSVLSGGEKVRCMISKTMLEEANFLILDEPTQPPRPRKYHYAKQCFNRLSRHYCFYIT